MEKNSGIIRLTSEHVILPFDCGDNDINDFLVSDAKAYQEKLLAVTYLIESAGKTVLYFCLSNDKITSIEHTNGFWRKLKTLFPHSKHRRDYPAVKIGRLGVDFAYQKSGLGLGSMVLDYIKHWMVSDNKTGCRFITVDAYRQAVPFYEKNGFLFMGNDERKRYEDGKGHTIAMYYDLQNVSAVW
ncbi:MAG: GNAT family N-acetyltransferase [Paludibacteraceae bacterium]|nr:GNAT family N-acetyltransferase [Paludibacteraceae bacterium]